MNQTSNRPIIALSATFTADPVRRPLSIWLRELCRDDVIRTAPYNQVLQSLLDPNSILVRTAGGSNVLLVCFQDWLHDRVDDLSQVGREFSDALSDFVCQSASPTLVYFLPPSPDLDRDALEAIQAAEQQALQSLEPLSGLHLITSEQLDRCYPVANRFDPVASRTGQIHYSQLYFTAIATSIARHLYGLRSRPRKVIVADADNTLWSGVCGEVGPNGVTVEAAHAELQKRLIQLRAQGFLVALCSKNSPQDVWDVFDLNPSMLLRREHIAAHELSWRPKSQGLRTIAATLGVGLDSLVLLDDNPVEIAEVRSNLLQATAIQIPSTERLTEFLDHLWPLDRLRVTDDDLSRADNYAVEAKRNELWRETESLAQFLQRLDLKVTFRQLDESSLERAAQLTQRTNQFNCTLRRSSGAELAQYMRHDGHHAWVVDVSDRFGNYGTVGLMAARCERAASDVARFEVDWFLLSCRALGRSVEHHMLRHLAQAAIDQQLGRLSISLTQGPRNQPATMFLDAMAQQLPGCETSGGEFRFPVDMVARIDPTSMAANVTAAADEAQSATQSPTGESRSNAADPADSDSELIQRIASEWSSPESFQQHIEQFASERPDLAEPYCGPTNDIEQTLAADVCNLLHLSQVGVTDPLHALGANSLMIVQLHSRIALSFGVELPITQLYNAATIRDIANHLITAKRDPAMSLPLAANDTTHMPATAKQVNSPEIDSSAIAVIGMAGRFPGAENVAEFWRNLIDGVNSIVSLEEDELNLAKDSPLRRHPNLVRKASYVRDVDKFDARFFGILPREAQVMDPQHRLFLESCWHAIEDAGYRPDAIDASVGVYAGCYMNTYTLATLAAATENPGLARSLANSFHGGDLLVELGNDKDYMATRVSFLLNLRGPSMTIQTACSTSLVATINACEALVRGQCDMALAGGATLKLPQKRGYLYSEGGMVSPDGTVRTFDADARGTVFGEGVAVVMLKRLADAMADGDDIYGVIRGWGINNDGRSKMGYTAPSVEGQSAAIRLAHQSAGISADSISYVEAHGTGTSLGDPIEIDSLSRAFRESTDAKQYCAIGSLKTNIGHLDVAAGAAGIIKICQALRHEVIPPSLNYRRSNPNIDFDNSPFYVVTEPTPWPQNEGSPRRAGLSSFGVGGTNAHIVIEQPPHLEATSATFGPRAVLVSARSEATLEAMTADLVDYLRSHANQNLADIAHTLAVGRKTHNYTRMVVAETIEEAAGSLATSKIGSVYTSHSSSRNIGVALMFPGQGAQHLNMARRLYDSDAVFRRELDRCCALLLPELGFDLIDKLFVSPSESAEQVVNQTSVAQPAIFSVSYALAKRLESLGIIPDVMIGHSVGEFVAATIAGVFSLDDALRLIAFRASNMQSLPTGSMMAVRCTEADVRSRLVDGSVEIAAVNGPSLCVVSGPSPSIEDLQQRLETEDIVCRLLHTSHAFHSAMMQPAVDPMTEQLRSITLHPPKTKIVSTVTGQPLTDAQATDPLYWANHLRETVRFTDAVACLLSEHEGVLVEVGAGQTLSTLAKQHPACDAKRVVLATLPHAKQSASETRHFVTTLGRLWQAGVTVDWAALDCGQKRRRLHLPTYRFDRTRHWFEPSEELSQHSLPVTAEAAESTSQQSDNVIETQNNSNCSDDGDCNTDENEALTPDAWSAAATVETVIAQQLELMKRQLSLWNQW